MIDPYKTGVPGNGKPFPDGAKMAKSIGPEKTRGVSLPINGARCRDVDFMVKDSQRFADSGGWGCGAFEYDPASDTFSSATQAADPPQGHDAKCGLACHTIVKNRDYVFTEYATR